MKLSRRALLRGAGVCLALPYLESLAPRAKAQAAPTKRFVACYFPNGTSKDHWPVSGSGSNYTLSPILQPLAKYKTSMSVFTNLENYSSMQDNQGVEPSHSRLCGAFLTCVDSDKVTKDMKVEIANATSVDQVIAQKMNTPLRSLEEAVRGASAALEASARATARQEIHEALHDLSRRPEPDRTGAVQHAMAALECVMRDVTGDASATLGDCLRRNPGILPPPLDKR